MKNIQHVQDLIFSEVNVKELELLDANNTVFVKSIKRNFKTIGPKYPKQMKAISAMVQRLDQAGIAAIEANGGWSGDIDGESVQLDMNDFDVRAEDIPGFLVASENGLTVALDNTISEALKQEGIARELVNRVQNLRKDSGLEVTDRIVLKVNSTEFIQKAIELNKEYVCAEVLANELQFSANPIEGLVTDIEAEGDTVIAVQITLA